MGWFIWGIAALFYAYEFTQRVAPSVMISELMGALQLDAGALGSLSAYYFYLYALCQIPAGLLIDRYRPQYMLTVAALLVSLGGLALIYSPSLFYAKASRALIGGGSAFAFIGCLKLAQDWMPSHRFPLIVGLTNFSGTLGALAGGAPLAFAVHYWGWQSALMFLSVLGFCIALLIFIFVKSPSSAKPALLKTPFSLTKPLKVVIQDRQTWLFALYGGLLVAPIAAFGELWSIPFLSIAYELSREQAAFLNSLIFMGIAIGGPTIGWLVIPVFINNPLLLCRVFTLFALIFLSLILFVHSINLVFLGIFLLLYGFATSHMLLCFTFVSKRHTQQFSGAALGLTNMVVMAGGALFQPFIGWLLDVQTNNTARMAFTVSEYHVAFALLPGCLMVAFLLTF